MVSIPKMHQVYSNVMVMLYLLIAFLLGIFITMLDRWIVAPSVYVFSTRAIRPMDPNKFYHASGGPFGELDFSIGRVLE